MNFLSHFYFDRHSTNPNIVLGAILPDLVSNARKDWKLRPEKREGLFTGTVERCILAGWKRHLAVDRHFHNSTFFKLHTGNIRAAVAPALENSAVRPSFLAHIALELMLDSILLTENVIHSDDLYDNLKRSDRRALTNFLTLSMLDDTEHFFRFFDTFLEAGYLSSYREAHNIMYALNRICMRVWPDPLTDTHILQLGAIIHNYHNELRGCYKEIFNEIELVINEDR